MSGLEGIEQFKARLEAMDRKLRNKTISQALRAGAKTMAEAVRSRARRRSGALAKSVKVRTGKRKKDRILMRVVVTGGHEDAVPVFEEFGTEHQAPHPFMRPGFDATRGPVRDAALDAIRRGIEESGK